MLHKLADVEARYNELNELMASPEVTRNHELLREYGQEQSNLAPIVEASRRYQHVLPQLAEARQMLAEEADDEMKDMIREEIDSLQSEQEDLEQRLQLTFSPVQEKCQIG